MAMERFHDNPWGDGNVLYLDCINIKIQVLILFYSFTAYYHRGKLGKGAQNLSTLFLTIAYESTVISKQNDSLKKNGKPFPLPDNRFINLLDLLGKRWPFF